MSVPNLTCVRALTLQNAHVVSPDSTVVVHRVTGEFVAQASVGVNGVGVVVFPEVPVDVVEDVVSDGQIVLKVEKDNKSRSWMVEVVPGVSDDPDEVVLVVSDCVPVDVVVPNSVVGTPVDCNVEVSVPVEPECLVLGSVE